MDCIACHKGNKQGKTKEEAHKGRLARPSDNLKNCGNCHIKAGQNFAKSLHFTSLGRVKALNTDFLQPN